MIKVYNKIGIVENLADLLTVRGSLILIHLYEIFRSRPKGVRVGGTVTKRVRKIIHPSTTPGINRYLKKYFPIYCTE